MEALLSAKISVTLLGGAFGNAMHKIVLERLVPRVLYAAGLCDSSFHAPWKKFDWRQYQKNVDRKGKLPDVMDAS